MASLFSRPISEDKSSRPISEDKASRPISEDKSSRPISEDKSSRPILKAVRSRQTPNHQEKNPICPDVAQKYQKIKKVGQGTFGEVFKARENKSGGRIVALKKILMENETEGFPITSLREIKILQALDNINVVELIEVVSGAPRNSKDLSQFYLVFEFCEYDLAGLLSNPKVKFSLAEIKTVMQQLFNGLFYIHLNKIMHRDLKSSNILITKDGVLKLADFGLARALKAGNKPNSYTNRVVTLWYRPPELLLGEKNYGPPVDMWGAGCIMGEMWTRSPILQGASEQGQLQKIIKLCGSITIDDWPTVERLPLFNQLKLPKNEQRRVEQRLKPHVKDDMGMDLIEKLLVLDPHKRINAKDCLDHDFLWTEPVPCRLTYMLSKHTEEMFEYSAQSRRHEVAKKHLAQAKQTTVESTSEYRTKIF